MVEGRESSGIAVALRRAIGIRSARIQGYGLLADGKTCDQLVPLDRLWNWVMDKPRGSAVRIVPVAVMMSASEERYGMFEESSVRFRRLGALTDAEKAACEAYQAEATFFHACAQRRERELTVLPAFKEFWKTCAEHHKSLVSAIAKFEVILAVKVYSGQANGTAVVGAIRGDVKKLIGLEYCYPGFISTSGFVEGADSFLERNQGASVRPVMLEIELDVGMNALPMREATDQVEVGEVLLGRNVRFDIVGVECKADHRFGDGVLWLSLKRHA